MFTAIEGMAKWPEDWKPGHVIEDMHKFDFAIVSLEKAFQEKDKFATVGDLVQPIPTLWNAADKVELTV